MSTKSTTIAHDTDKYGREVTIEKVTTEPDSLIGQLIDPFLGPNNSYRVNVEGSEKYRGSSHDNAREAFNRRTEK